MSETILTWNVQNWITVTLMAVIGYAVMRIVITAMNGSNGSSS